MGPYRKLWFTLIAVLAVTFAARLLRRRGLPTGAAHPADRGRGRRQRLFGRDDILDGQTAWQSVGGMQLGSVSHGAYQAPDWTADWLHRELGAWLDLAAREAHGQPYAELPAPAQAALRETLKAEYRGNRVNADEVLTVSARARHRPDRRLL